MLSLLASTIPLALAAAVTPTLIAVQLLVVAGEVPWRLRAALVVLANFVGFALVVSLLLAGLAQLPDAGSGDPGIISAIVRLVAAGLLALISVWFFIPHPELVRRTQRTIESRLDHASPWLFFALALYFSVTDVSSFVVLMPALHDVTASDHGLMVKVLVLVVIFAFALQATLAPALVRIVGGRRVVPALNSTYGWVMRNQFPVVGVVCAVVSVFLLVDGLRRL